MDAKRIERPFTAGNVVLFSDRCARLVAFLEHINQWPVGRELITVPQDLVAQVERFGELLEQCFNRTSKGLKKRKLLGEDSRTDRPRYLVPEDAVELGDELVQLTRTLSSALQGIYTAINKHNVNVKFLAEVRTIDELTSEFRDLCAVDDCLEMSPAGVIKKEDVIAINISPDVIQSTSAPILIVGPPGSGKTSLCRHLVLLDAERVATTGGTRTPVYVAMHRMRPTDGSLLDDLIARAGISALLPKSKKHSRPQLRLYLDGLDEVSSRAGRKELAKRLGNEQQSNAHVVITARDYVYDSTLRWTTRLTIRSFTEQDLELLAQQWLHSDSVQIERFFAELKKTSGLGDVVKTPLLATVTLMVFKQTGRLPETKARLYTMFTSLLCGGWDLAKGINRGNRFSVPQKVGVLCAVASYMHERGTKEIGDNTFRRIVSSMYERGTVVPSLVLAEIVGDGMLVRNQRQLHFPHLSYQEFLAAKNMLGDPDGASATAALIKYLDGNDWWQEVLMFYGGLAERPDAIASWIKSHPRFSDTAKERAGRLIDTLRQTFPNQLLGEQR